VLKKLAGRVILVVLMSQSPTTHVCLTLTLWSKDIWRMVMSSFDCNLDKQDARKEVAVHDMLTVIIVQQTQSFDREALF